MTRWQEVDSRPVSTCRNQPGLSEQVSARQRPVRTFQPKCKATRGDGCTSGMNVRFDCFGRPEAVRGYVAESRQRSFGIFRPASNPRLSRLLILVGRRPLSGNKKYPSPAIDLNQQLVAHGISAQCRRREASNHNLPAVF